MSADRNPDLHVGLLFRITPERPAAGSDDARVPVLPQYRLGWVICTGGSPLLTLDCRIPADVDQQKR